MNKFKNPSDPCPKCGHKTFFLDFKERTTFCGVEVLPEHLEKQCEYCSFIIREIPLDAQS